MIGLFDDLKELGFEDLGKVELFPPKEEPSEKEKAINKKKISIEEVLYDKSCVCPVCTKEFKTKAIRSGKNRLLTVDLDLKANYEVVNPLIYECIVCESCGYAALSKNFTTLTTSQIKWIQEQITTKYKPYHYPPILTEKDGIMRYKLALLNSYVKKAKDGEKGYICLKIAWLYRDIKEKALEELFLQHALTGFENAYSNERFPIFELGELTTAYIIADIYRRLKDYDKAMKWVSFVVVDRSVSLRLKTKALHLKSIISEEKQKAKGAQIE